MCTCEPSALGQQGEKGLAHGSPCDRQLQQANVIGGRLFSFDQA